MPPRRAPKQTTRAASPKPARPAASGVPVFPKLHPIVGDALIILILFLLLVFVYRGFIIEGKVAVSADTLIQGAPFDQFVRLCAETYHTPPLWYPNIFSGMPFQASGTYQHLQYTYEGLLRRILPDVLFDGLHGRVTFHLMLGGVSMLLLARALSLSRAAGFIAAAAFLLNGHVIGTEHVNRLASFMHIPLIFFAAYRLFERRNVLYTVLLGGAFGSQLGSYHPQIAYYTGMMIGLFVVYTIIADVREKKSVRLILVNVALFAVAIGLAIGMAAVMVLPMREYVQYSARSLSVGGSSVNVPFATSWSFPPMEVLTFILPSFAGFGKETYWGEMPFTDFPNYLGIVVVLLAVIGLFFRRNRTTIFLTLLALMALLVSFGKYTGPLSTLMLQSLPYFAKFRAPVMILILLQFAVAVLAGYGTDAIAALVASPHKKEVTPSRLPRWLGVLAASLIVIALILTLTESSFQSAMAGVYSRADAAHGDRDVFVKNPDLHAQVNAERFTMFFNDLWKMALLFAGTAGLVIAYATRKVGHTLLTLGLAGLAGLDLLLVDVRLVNPQYEKGSVEAYYTQREDEVIKTLKRDTDLFRVFPVENFGTNEYGYYGIASIGGYHAAKLGIYQELLEAVGLNSLAVLNMLNTKYLISRQPLASPVFKPVVDTPEAKLYQNMRALPRAFLVDRVKVIKDKKTIFEELKGPTFDPSTYAILEEPLPLTLGSNDSATVRVTRNIPNRIDLAATATAPCLLVLSEVYYPAGWAAQLDGQPAKIYKTNYALRSVVLPAGRHTITFEFNPRSFTTGLRVTQAASLLVLVVLCATGIQRGIRDSGYGVRGKQT
ncbi:MAG: YfhO family protein [Candidatus Latescibacteria bacterium]|nr:YfhO family protein [Candidatus Latescibacterota bacterium]